MSSVRTEAPRPDSGRDRRPDRGREIPIALLAAGVMLVAVNLRPAAASVGPVLGRIQASTGMSSGWAGLLATTPVLCFGLIAPFVPAVARRLGAHGAVAFSMWALLTGLLVRLLPGVPLLVIGTVMAGSAIAVCNVLLPVVVRRDFAGHAGTTMALYTSLMIGFAALSAGVTVPIADALGGGWRPGLGIWTIPAVAAALAWVPALVRRPVAVAEPGPRVNSAVRLLRRPLAWQVTLFFAFQSGAFYGTLVWLPTIFRSHGASAAHAGVLLSVTLVVGVLPALTLPRLATRLTDQRLMVAGVCLLTVIGWAGILIAPMSAPYLWVVLLGLGQNGAFPLALMLIVMRGGSVAATEGLSALAQSVGYGLAAVAPIAVGAIHAAAHSWTPAVILLLALTGPQFAFGLGAGRGGRSLAESGSAA